MPYCCRRWIVDGATGGIRKCSLELSRAVTLCGRTSRPISPSSYSCALDTDCWLPKAANTIFRYLGHFAPTLSAMLAAKNDTCHPWSKSTQAIANPRRPAMVAVVVIKCTGAVWHVTDELISCGGFRSKFNNIIMVPPLANFTSCWQMIVFDWMSWPQAVKTPLMLSYVVVAGRHFKLLQRGYPPLLRTDIGLTRLEHRAALEWLRVFGQLPDHVLPCMQYRLLETCPMSSCSRSVLLGMLAFRHSRPP